MTGTEQQRQLAAIGMVALFGGLVLARYARRRDAE
jgi:LPXTG-motif cell wall-anchored protein